METSPWCQKIEHRCPTISLQYGTRSVGLPSDSGVKNPPANTEGMGSIPGLARSPGGGNGNLFQYPCWENPMDRGAWWATVHGIAKKPEVT